MRKGIGIVRLSVCLLIFGIGIFLPYRKGGQADSKTVVSGYDKLREELEAPGKRHIKIAKNIRISEPVYVKGEKVIEGKGYLITRTVSGKSAYRGSLFIVNGGSLTVKGLVISGGGKGKSLQGGVSGRLVEVKNGKFVMEKGSVLKNNVNDRLAMSGGGAVSVQENGKFYMNGGSILSNKSVMGGAGVRIEARGLFCMTGGRIEGNQTCGVGAVEGFDGRGGAIYNEGTVKISGGRIRGNEVKKYSDRQHEYGGVGGMMYNRGTCVITGGTVIDNKAASCGGAIYSDTQSRLRIMGGTIRRNGARRGKEIYGAGGICSLSGSPVLESVYLCRDFGLEADKGLRVKQKILLAPEKYEKGRRIVKGGKERDFLIERKKTWSLRQGKQGLFLARKRKEQKSAGTPAQKLPGKKTQSKRLPVLRQSNNPLRFYEGEYVGKQALCFGIIATDEKDGNLKEKVRIRKIVYPDGKTEINPDRLDTSKTGVGSIFYKVTNSQGYSGKLKTSYRILENRRTVIHMSPRYLFAWEVQKYSPEKWREVLLANCRLEDDCETEAELLRTVKIEWNGLTANRAGHYMVSVSVRDQQGHRYYMKKGQIKRYGEGKTGQVRIPVTLVEGSHDGGSVMESYVRFFSQSAFSAGESEVWRFAGSDITRIKQYMARQENPFSTESNDEFLREFRYCYKGKERTQVGEE